MSGSNSGGENIHYMQKLLDNQWILLLLGVMVPMVLYTGWGIWDVINIPQVK